MRLQLCACSYCRVRWACSAPRIERNPGSVCLWLLLRADGAVVLLLVRRLRRRNLLDSWVALELWLAPCEKVPAIVRVIHLGLCGCQVFRHGGCYLRLVVVHPVKSNYPPRWNIANPVSPMPDPWLGIASWMTFHHKSS